MTPLTIIIHAVVIGALINQQQPHPAVWNAYRALIDYLHQQYPTDSLALLEKKPDFAAWKAALTVELTETTANLDAELLELATATIEAALAHPTETPVAVAVDLESVKAETIRLRNIQSSGKSAHLKQINAREVIIDTATSGKGGKAFSAEFSNPIEKLEVNILSDKPDDEKLLQMYRSRVLNKFDRLKLDGIDPEVAKNEGANRLRLSAVYTALLTKASDWRETGMLNPRQNKDRQISAVEQLNNHQYLVLLGDPGSGKSTFVDFVALCLAGEGLQDPEINLKLLTKPLPLDDAAEEEKAKERPEFQRWQQGALLPVRVILRDLVAWEGFPTPSKAASAATLWKFVAHEMQENQLDECCHALENHLKNKGGLILLDGLDEVPDANQRRKQIVEMINDFCASFRKCRLLVTSRPYAYTDRAWHLNGFAVNTLDDFSRGQIRHFIEEWYRQRATVLQEDLATAEHRAQQLNATILHNPRLYELAQRPLLLTLTAGIHAWKLGSLPEGRAELYEQAIQLLLVGWEDRLANNPNPEIASQSLSKLLGIERSDLRPVLEQIAFQAHHEQEGLVGSADIEIGRLLVAFNQLLREKRLAEISESRLIRYLEQRSGLLIARAENRYALPHRTFQEFLAASYLLRDDFPDKLVGLVRKESERWREVALLAAAQGSKIPSTVWDMVEMLSARQQAGEPALAQAWGFLLAGQAVDEGIKAEDRQRRPTKLAQVQSNLVEVIEGTALPAAERALAGRTLAKLGDPRPYANSVAGMEFCFVPKGTFYRTTDNQTAHNQLENLDYDFWMGRFPVTQAQFAEFTKAGGYAIERYWTEAIEAGHWKEGAVINWFNNTYQSSPHFFGGAFDLPNHPVVGITWYEAVAFCRWLTEQQANGQWDVRLPTEMEWEKAARGGVEILQKPEVRREGEVREHPPNDGEIGQSAVDKNPFPQRSYPWGEAAATDRANYKASKIDTTSAVGCFVNGASPYGIEELCGTVWEWSQDKYESWGMVLRGGAYYNDEILTSARGGDPPYYGNDLIGFRCVFVPSSR